MAWKPIETAPKSDARVVVFSALWGDMAICRWSNDAGCFVLDVADNFRDDDFWFCDPTHWDDAPDEPA